MEKFKFFLWSAGCVGVGIFLSTVEFGGKTTVQHVVDTWNSEAPGAVENIKSGFGNASKKGKGSRDDDDRPNEHYAPDDRAAVNKIVSRSGKGSKK